MSNDAFFSGVPAAERAPARPGAPSAAPSAAGALCEPAGRLTVLPSVPRTPPRLRTVLDAVGANLAQGWRCKVLVISADLAAVLVVAAMFGHVGALEACVALVTWLVVGLHRSRFTVSVLDDVPRLAVGCLVAAVAVLAVNIQSLSRALLSALALLVTAVLARAAAYVGVRRLRRQGRETFSVLVVGCGPTSDTLLERVAAHPETGVHVVGRLGSRREATRADTVPFRGSLEALPATVERSPARTLIVCEADEPAADIVEALRRSRTSRTTVEIVPALHDLHALERATDELWGLPLVRLRRSRREWFARGCKRALDMVVAAVGLVVVAPLIVVIALAVRWELGPGVLFRQERVGLYGRRFSLLKFRSVRPCPGAEQAWSVASLEMGRIGRFIRKYSLDELPQLWNVVRGDMSLVGPRPERPEYVTRFTAEVPTYHHRHRVPVGLTGLAVVRGLRGAASSIAERAYFDNLYIETWSFWLDIKILLLTVRSVLRGTGG